MSAAAFVIPLAALVVPIVLILLAVLVDIVVLLWYGYAWWRDEWSVRVGHYALDHFVTPIRRAAHVHRPA